MNDMNDKTHIIIQHVNPTNLILSGDDNNLLNIWNPNQYTYCLRCWRKIPVNSYENETSQKNNSLEKEP